MSGVSHYYLHITDDITKGQIDMIIEKVNDKLDKDDSIWYMRYDGIAPDAKYWVSFEVKRGMKPLGQELKEKFFSLRISRFQFKDKYVDINNKNNLIKDAPKDSYILTKNENYYNKKRNGLNLHLYNSNISCNDFKYLLYTFKNELDNVGASIIRKKTGNSKLEYLNPWE